MRLCATWAGLLIVGLLPFVREARAQEEAEVVEAETETVEFPQWEMDLAGRLSASQARYRNWTEGGISSIASAAGISGKFERTSREWLQTFEIRLAIGIIKQDTLAFRKAEDLIRLMAQVNHRGSGFFKNFNPMVAGGLRTQFAPGYNYDRNPLGDGRPPPVGVSDIFSPATLTQSLGLAYSADWGFTHRLGVAAKESIVLIPRFRPLYGHALSEAVRFQLGVESQTEIDREIFTNVELNSTLGFFAAFNQENLPDMLWENQVIMQVNRWLSTDFEIVMLFDRDISDAVQFKQALSVGLSVVLL